jgi:uncharacterized protein
MKMALDTAGHVNLVRSYAPGRVRVRNREFTASVIVSAELIVEDWAPRSVDALRTGHLDALTHGSPEVVILGTGERQVFPEPAILSTLMDFGIGCEVMDNGAACRTYNVLLSEQRRVTLALLIDDRGT